MAEDQAGPKRAQADKAEERAVALPPLEKLDNHADQVCRICHGEADPENGPFLQPCVCKGTIAFVHKRCIEDSLRVWGDRCTVCRTRIKMPRERAPLWHCFHGFINWEDTFWFDFVIVTSVALFLWLVLVIVMEYLGTPGWITRPPCPRRDPPSSSPWRTLWCCLYYLAMTEDHASPKRVDAENAEEAALAPRLLEKLENHADQVCRVCYGEADLENGPLFQPCACKGTIAFVHKQCIERCLREWGDMCTVCHTRIRTRRKRVPLWHFLRGFINWKDVLWIAINGVMVAVQVFLLVVVWTVVTEYLGTQVWIRDLPGIAGLLVFTVMWIMMETFHEQYEIWRKRSVTVELLLPHSEAQNDQSKQAARIAVATGVLE
ncbi:hypothetical protein MTO96_028194 [Rhipicephalus appendiculatus]